MLPRTCACASLTHCEHDMAVLLQLVHEQQQTIMRWEYYALQLKGHVARGIGAPIIEGRTVQDVVDVGTKETCTDGLPISETCDILDAEVKDEDT